MVDLAPKWARELAEEGLKIAREQLEEMKRHHAEVERLLAEIRDRCGPKAWAIDPVGNTNNSTVPGVVTDVKYGVQWGGNV